MKQILAVLVVCGLVISVAASGYFASYDTELQDSKPAVCTKHAVPDYDIIPKYIELSESATGLIEAGKVFPGAHVCESELNPILQEMATRHAKYQATHNRQGHQLFDQRVKELNKTLGKYKYSEVAAEAWKNQKDETKFNLGIEAFTCWKKSPGHWNVVSKKHTYFGADAALGSNGVWYFVIIVADK